MRRSVSLALIAGLALASSAMAQVDIPTAPVRAKPVPVENYRPGIVKPVEMGTRGLSGMIYQNTDELGGFLTTTTSVAPWCADDVHYRPGNASALPGLITSMEIGFQIPATSALADFDIIIEFFDTYNNTAPVTSTAFESSLGAFVVGYTAMTPGGWTSNIDLTGLPGGGIPVAPDFGGYMTMRFVLPGTNTLVTAPDYANPSFGVTLDNAGVNQHISGYSSTVFWRDANATPNGVLDNTDGRTFAYPTQGRFHLILNSDEARCPSDFNNDGFPDAIDYDGFIAAFLAGC